MKIYLLFCFPFFLLSPLELLAQNCTPEVHVNYFKQKTKGKVIKEFLLNFKKDSIVGHKVKLKAHRFYIIDFGTKGGSNQGIILTVLKNGYIQKNGYFDAEANMQFPAKLYVNYSTNYTIRFSYRKDYIKDYCAGAILVEY